jgi:anaerobic selenocysteine-containing dehydrogenase
VDQIVAAARMYADGPSTFVSGHGIDAFSVGVQTFRTYHCLVAISGNLGMASSAALSRSASAADGELRSRWSG